MLTSNRFFNYIDSRSNIKKNPFFMSPNKSSNIIKYCVITSTFAIVIIAFTLIPISRKAAYWNRCLDKTVRWFNEKDNDLKGWDKSSKVSIAVAVCNGAVYEPKVERK